MGERTSCPTRMGWEGSSIVSAVDTSLPKAARMPIPAPTMTTIGHERGDQGKADPWHHRFELLRQEGEQFPIEEVDHEDEKCGGDDTATL